jgi:hypothetical protein
MVEVEDPDGDAASVEWQVLPEVTRAGYAGRGEQHAQPIPGLVNKSEGGTVTFTAPEQDGPYRLFVFVRDGKGNGGTANIPFMVQH